MKLTADHDHTRRVCAVQSRLSISLLNIFFFPPNRGVDFYFEFLPAKILPAKIEETISILNFFPPNRGFDFYCQFLLNNTANCNHDHE